MLSAIDQANTAACSSCCTQQTSYENGMLDPRGKGCQNALKLMIIISH